MKNRILTIAILLLCFSAKAQVNANYTYDNLNRLTKVVYSNGKGIQYSYDALGNRSQKIAQSNLSVEDISRDSFVKLYPNPFVDELKILSDKPSIKEVILMDMSGKQIKRFENLNTKEYKLNASQLPAGNYLVSVRTENGVETYKVIKK